MFKLILKSFLTLTLALNVSGFLSTNAHADSFGDDQPDNYVSVNVFANQTKVTAGDTIRLGLEQTIYPKWHTYWLNPGDSGLPFSVEWQLPEGFEVTPLEWATPSKIPFDELTNYGYEEKVVLLQNLTLPKTYDGQPLTIEGTSNMLVCHDICIPESHPVQLVLNGDAMPKPALIELADSKLPQNLEVSATYSIVDTNVEINIESNDLVLSDDQAYIAPEEWGLVYNSGALTVTKTDAGYTLSQKRGDRDLTEIKDFPFVFSSAAQETGYRIVAKPSVKEALAIALTPKAEPIVLESASAASGFTFVKAIIFALLGGLILNLMPCVFPVLSMKALSLVQLNDKEEKKAKLYGLSYTAGILLSFLLIAGILIALKSAGAQIGWGFQLQNPIVISVLVYVIFIIGLNLSGFFEISGGLGNMGQKLAAQSGNKGAFFTGVLATIVATPCTAPFMGAAMGYALTQPAYVSLIVFIALGLGLALPYLALCFIPALRTKLPRPGAWMETFRQFLSFPMFLTAVFLVWVLSQQAGTMSVLIILTAMVALVFAIWLWKHMPTKGIMRGISLAIFVLMLLFSILAPFTLSTQTSVTGENIAVGEIAYSPATLEEKLKTNNPVFTNMTADWCITCKVNERIAIKTNSVQQIFKDKNVQYIKGDWTNADPEITQYLNSFDRQGVPLYVYYGAPDEQTGKRPEPVVLPQLLTAGVIAKIIQ